MRYVKDLNPLVFKSVEHLINRNLAFPDELETGKWQMCCRKGDSANNK